MKLPDNIVGGLILSLVNMLVVFLVLGSLAFVIQITYRLVSRGSREQAESQGLEEVEETLTREEETPGLSGPVRAAIAAAIAAYMEEESKPVPVFVREAGGMGDWTKSTLYHSDGLGARGASLRWSSRS